MAEEIVKVYHPKKDLQDAIRFIYIGNKGIEEGDSFALMAYYRAEKICQKAEGSMLLQARELMELPESRKKYLDTLETIVIIRNVEDLARRGEDVVLRFCHRWSKEYARYINTKKNWKIVALDAIRHLEFLPHKRSYFL